MLKNCGLLETHTHYLAHDRKRMSQVLGNASLSQSVFLKMTMRCDHTGYIATHKQTHAKLHGSGHGKDKAAWIGRQSNRDWRTLTYAQKNIEVHQYF